MFTEVAWIPAITFVLITALTPGPNNLSCASMGVMHGYKQSIKYILGIVLGILIVSTLAGWAADLILTIFPVYEKILRVIGAIYLLWLAFRTLKISYADDEHQPTPMGFKDGLILQFINVKVLLFSLTLYAAYLQPVTSRFLPLFLTASGLAARAFLVNSLWVLFGASIRRWLRKPVIGNAFNTLVALALVYNASDLLGIPQLISAQFN